MFNYIYIVAADYIRPLRQRTKSKVKVKQSRYTPWRRLGREDI
jgi:hypothetical protein